jgi:invasion protein IalB
MILCLSFASSVAPTAAAIAATQIIAAAIPRAARAVFETVTPLRVLIPCGSSPNIDDEYQHAYDKRDFKKCNADQNLLSVRFGTRNKTL